MYLIRNLVPLLAGKLNICYTIKDAKAEHKLFSIIVNFSQIYGAVGDNICVGKISGMFFFKRVTM